MFILILYIKKVNNPLENSRNMYVPTMMKTSYQRDTRDGNIVYVLQCNFCVDLGCRTYRNSIQLFCDVILRIVKGL